MDKRPKEDQWVWVLIQNPGGNEQILGQQDEKNDIAFIPAFETREDALKCYHLMARGPEKKDEFQAIIFEDLRRYASENGFLIFLLNASGEIIEKVAP